MKQVDYKIENGVMTITIDNPETKNGLNWEGIEQLADCYEVMEKNKSIRVAVITGNNQYFYTGGRVDAAVQGEQEKYANAIDRLDGLMTRHTTPMVAAVSGLCLKAGMGMIASCDFAVAREGVEFGYPEVRMGGVPMMVLVDTVDLMPRKRALEAYLTSWNFSAEEAYRMGLINRVVPQKDFQDTVHKYVQVFLDTPPEIIEMTKRAYDTMVTMTKKEERVKFAGNMLRTEVLPWMATAKTEYNV